jgi:hypothetical protein
MTGGVHLSAGRGECKGGAAGGVFPCGRRQSDRAPPVPGQPGQEGEMGRPRGRGLVGRGGAASWREEKMSGPWLGRKRRKNSFLNKI